MKLEEQLEKLATIGLSLAPGITIDDVLFSFDREQYESSPFELILFTLGVEVERRPWGRPFCERAWNFDTECINVTGNYVEIVRRLCRVAGKEGAIQNVTDQVDMEAKNGWLKYALGTVQRNWTIEVDNDWADMMVLTYVMADLESDGWKFYGKDNGQAVVLFYLEISCAKTLNEWSGGALRPMVV